MSWKTLHINNELYLIKYIKLDEEKKITCFLSDFKCIWKETLKFGDIIKRANDLNPLIQNEEESTVLNTILEPAVHCQLNENGNTSNDNRGAIMNNNEDLLANVDVDTELKIFRNKYYIIDDVPFKFLWKLMQCSQTVFYNEITKPLLMLVTITSMQQTDLKELLRKKDTEIEQYKIEGAQLIRKTVSTLPFNDIEFIQKFTLKNELDNSFLELSKNEKHLNAIEKFCDIKILPFSTSKSNASNISPNSKHMGKSGSSNKRDNKKSLKDMLALRKFHTAIDTKIIYNSRDDPSSQEDNYEDNDDAVNDVEKSNEKSSDDKIDSVSSINDNNKATTVIEEVGQPAKKMKIHPKLNLFNK